MNYKIPILLFWPIFYPFWWLYKKRLRLWDPCSVSFRIQLISRFNSIVSNFTRKVIDVKKRIVSTPMYPKTSQSSARVERASYQYSCFFNLDLNEQISEKVFKIIVDFGTLVRHKVENQEESPSQSKQRRTYENIIYLEIH